MAYSYEGQNVSLKAGADLSDYQYRFVTLDSSGEVQLCTGLGDYPLGILQNDPESGHEASVRIGGTSKLHAGDTGIEIGGYIRSNTDGKGLGATGMVGARALEDANTQDDLIGVQVIPSHPLA